MATYQDGYIWWKILNAELNPYDGWRKTGDKRVHVLDDSSRGIYNFPLVSAHAMVYLRWDYALQHRRVSLAI